ncbi:hypothetical protein Tco_0056789 [Tanacetum coccineum]
MTIKPVPDGDPIFISELTKESSRTGDKDGDKESLNYEIGDGVGMRIFKRAKNPQSPWGSPIPIEDGDRDVKRFPDGDGDGDGDEAHKKGWGW